MTNEFVRLTKNTLVDRLRALATCAPPSRAFIVIFTAFSISSFVWADEPTVKPGIYEGLMLAADGTGNILGYYKESQGEGVVKTCSFFLKGRISDGQYNIDTWNDALFPGELRPIKDGVSLKIERGQEHPGCGLVLLPQIADGISLDKTKDGSWSILKIVSVTRARLYSEPVEERIQRSYFVKGDVVGVLSKSESWIKVEYPREGKKSVIGWLKSSDVDDFAPVVKQ